MNRLKGAGFWVSSGISMYMGSIGTTMFMTHTVERALVGLQGPVAHSPAHHKARHRRVLRPHAQRESQISDTSQHTSLTLALHFIKMFILLFMYIVNYAYIVLLYCHVTETCVACLERTGRLRLSYNKKNNTGK